MWSAKWESQGCLQAGVPALAVCVIQYGKCDPASLAHPTSRHSNRAASKSRPDPKILAEMFEAAGGLLDGAAFDAEHDVPRAGLADLDHLGPVDHAVAAGAAHGRAGHLAALGVRLLDRDVLGVQMDQSVLDVREPGERVLAGQVAVAGVEIDADRRGISPGRRCGPGRPGLAVLLVRLQADEDPARLGDGRRLLQHVPHQRVVFLDGGPVRLWGLRRC